MIANAVFVGVLLDFRDLNIIIVIIIISCNHVKSASLIRKMTIAKRLKTKTCLCSATADTSKSYLFIIIFLDLIIIYIVVFPTFYSQRIFPWLYSCLINNIYRSYLQSYFGHNLFKEISQTFTEIRLCSITIAKKLWPRKRQLFSRDAFQLAEEISLDICLRNQLDFRMVLNLLAIF